MPLVILTALGTAFMMVAPGIAYVVIAFALGAITRHPSTEQLLIAQTVTYVPWGIYLLLVLPRVARTSLRDLGFRAPTGRDVAIALGGTLAMWLAVTLVGAAIVVLTHVRTTEAAIAMMRDLRTPGERALFVAIAVGLAPMLEELTFRVFLFNAISRYTTVAFAALGSGLIFGLVHASPKSPHEIGAQLLTVSLPLLAGGVVLAYVYAITRCYWANVITHGAFNAISVVAIMAFHAT